MSENEYGYPAQHGTSSQYRPIKGSWQDPRTRTRTLDAPFAQQPQPSAAERQQEWGRGQGIPSRGNPVVGSSSDGSGSRQNAQHYGGMSMGGSGQHYGYANGLQAGPSMYGRSGRDGQPRPGRRDLNDNESYASTSVACQPSSSSQRAGAQASPTLPNLQTRNRNGGFTDLYAQLEAQMDEIQAKHSPISSPNTPTQLREDERGKGYRSQASEARPTTGRAYSQSLGSPVDPSSGIISMYGGAHSPLPPPEPSNGRYTYVDYSRVSSNEGRHEPRDTYQIHPEVPQRPSEGLSMQQQAVQAPYVPRQRTTSANTTTTVNSLGSSRRPLPESPATSMHEDGRSALPLPRPSQDSFASSSYGYSAGSGTAAPRPSMSSTYSGRSVSNGPRDVRPLPVPTEEDESFIISPADVSGSSAYETASTLSSSRSIQSDFSRDFYAAGSRMPDELRQQSSQQRPRKKTASQPTAVSNSQATISSSVSFPEVIQRQSASVQSSRPSTSGTSASSRSGSYKTGPAIESAAPSRHENQPGSPSPASTVDMLSHDRMASGSQFRHAPPMSHSHSDPVANTRSASFQYRRVEQPLPRAPSASGSGSAATSASFSAANSGRTVTKLRSPSSGKPGDSRSGRPSLPEVSPPLPSSPSISISHSLDGTSANSSYTERTGTSYRSQSVKKQASLAPSLPPSHGLGYLPSMRRDPDQDKRRAERLGIQHINPALLSNLAQTLSERLPRATNIKGAIHYPGSFTGEQLVTTLAEALPFPYTDDRRVAHSIARTLHQNMFFHEADWDLVRLRDSAEQVFCFENDEEESTFDYLNSSPATNAGPSRMPNITGRSQDDLPIGILTRFTKCYSPFCGMEGTSGSGACYSLYCPNGTHPVSKSCAVLPVSY